MDADTRKLYTMKAEVIAAAGHPIRLAILEFLRDGEQCVCDIARHVDAKRSNVSRHLGVLLKVGIVSHRKDGLRMMYALRTPCILNVADCVANVLRAQAQETQMVLGTL